MSNFHSVDSGRFFSTRYTTVLLACGVLLGLVAVPAQGNTQAVEFRVASATWFVPLEKADFYRQIHVEVTRTDDLLTGQVSATATVTRERCRKDRLSETQVLFECGHPRDWTTDVARLEMAEDLSSAIATFELAGRSNVVRFREPEETEGVGSRREVCSPPDVTATVGTFENMDKAYGQVLGWRLSTQSGDESYDYAWLEHGFGLWCN